MGQTLSLYPKSFILQADICLFFRKCILRGRERSLINGLTSKCPGAPLLKPPPAGSQGVHSQEALELGTPHGLQAS